MTQSARRARSPKGLIVIDKQGDRILFLDPLSLRTLEAIEDMPKLPHELAISPDQTRAYVPAYGDGVHGDNPHPNHLISVIDLQERRRLDDIELQPLQAPHTLRFGRDGLLYICCEKSAVIAIYDPQQGGMVGEIETGSANSHRLAILPQRAWICTDNEEDASVSILDIAARSLVGRIQLPCAIAGIAAAKDESAVVVTSADHPEILILDVEGREVRKKITLQGHDKPGQVVRFSPDGRWLLVVGDHEPVISLIEIGGDDQRTIRVGKKPMDGVFHPNGRSLLIANEGDATLSQIDLVTGRVLRTVACGSGCETLGYF